MNRQRAGEIADTPNICDIEHMPKHRAEKKANRYRERLAFDFDCWMTVNAC